MKANTALILGILATAGGWGWLMFGTSLGASGSAPRMYNLQLGAMAEQLCMLGYTLIIAGTIQSAATFISNNASSKSAIATRQSDEGSSPNPRNDLSNLMTGRNMPERRPDQRRY